MGRFESGKSGNPAGRPKGARNKVTPPLKQEIESFLIEQWPQLKRDWKKLEPAARIAMFEKLARFVLPQPRQTDLSIDFSQLTDEQMDLIVSKILEDGNP